MRYVRIDGLDEPVSVVALGVMGATPDTALRTFELLDAFAAAGGNFVDTAHVYGDGAADRTLGRWLAERGRHAAVVLGKGCHPRADGVARVDPASLSADLGESLERLGTDHLDVYLLHRDDPAVPVGELLTALNDELCAGRFRAFGASNWTAARVAEANAYAAANGLVPFALNSPGWSLAEPRENLWGGCRYADDDCRELHSRTQLPLLAWSAQARGFFSGRYAPGDGATGDVPRTYYSDDNFGRARRANLLAERMGATANAVALAYVLNQPFPTIGLVGPNRLAQLRDSLSSADLVLTAEDLSYLESGSPQ